MADGADLRRTHLSWGDASLLSSHAGDPRRRRATRQKPVRPQQGRQAKLRVSPPPSESQTNEPDNTDRRRVSFSLRRIARLSERPKPRPASMLARVFGDRTNSSASCRSSSGSAPWWSSSSSFSTLMPRSRRASAPLREQHSRWRASRQPAFIVLSQHPAQSVRAAANPRLVTERVRALDHLVPSWATSRSQPGGGWQLLPYGLGTPGAIPGSCGCLENR